MKAYVEAISVIHRDKSFTMKAIAKYSMERDPEALQESYDFVVKALPRVPEPTLDAIRSGLKLLAERNPEAASADPSRFIDTRFIRELKENGYIASLYK